jgi:hypothetical protein
MFPQSRERSPRFAEHAFPNGTPRAFCKNVYRQGESMNFGISISTGVRSVASTRMALCWLIKGLGMTIGISGTGRLDHRPFPWHSPSVTLRVTKYRAAADYGNRPMWKYIAKYPALLVQMFFWFYAGPMLFGESLVAGNQPHGSGWRYLCRHPRTGAVHRLARGRTPAGRLCFHQQGPIPGGAVHRHDPGRRCTVMSSFPYALRLIHTAIDHGISDSF